MITAAPGVPRGFTRRRIARGEGPVPLAFVFDGSPRQPKHLVTVVRWTDAALQQIHDLQEHVATLEPQRRLATEALRGRLEVADPDNLRLDRGLGLRGRPPELLWTVCVADFVARQLEGQEILPGLGGLRRVASGRLDAN